MDILEVISYLRWVDVPLGDPEECENCRRARFSFKIGVCEPSDRHRRVTGLPDDPLGG